MRKLFLASLFVFLFSFETFAQNIENCPQVEFISEQENALYYGQPFSIYAVGSGVDWEKIKSTWKVSNNLSFEIEGSNLISGIHFIPTKELSNQSITVSIRLEGLPKECKSVFTKEYKINFIVQVGDPPKIDEFGRIPISEERKRLDAIALGFKECEGCLITIILYDQSKNNTQRIQNRITRISRYLKDKHNIPENSCKFVNGGIGEYSTEIWFIPSFSNLLNDK